MSMHIIVPLAGPDFTLADGRIKALIPFQGEPLLKYVLDSRPWASKATRYCFALHDCATARKFSYEYLSSWYPGCSIVYLSTISRGAALSALAAVSLVNEFCQPMIIDLADIYYSSSLDIEYALQSQPDAGGIALVFESTNPQYSYLAIDNNGMVIEAAEKKVISNKASAGTYIFDNCSTFLKAIGHAIDNAPSQTHGNLFYVCPLFNGVLSLGRQVALEPVFDVMDIKLIENLLR